MAASYAQLLTDIPNMIEDPTSELLGMLPTTIIPMAEFRMSRDLVVDLFDYVANNTLTIGSPFISRPADLIAQKYLYITLPTNAVKVLQFKELGYLLEYWPSTIDTGEPVYYSTQDATSYRIAPTPDLAYSYQFGYRRILAPLSPANQTNALTANYYDALLAACCAEAARYVIDDRQAGLINIWEGRYNQAVLGINNQQTQQERDDFRAVFNPTDNRPQG